MRRTLARFLVIGLGVAASWPAASLQAGVAVPHLGRGARPGAIEKPASGKFLVAKREMLDPNFARTVVLLLSYDDHGAVGLVVNRRSDTRVTALLPQIDGLKDRTDRVFLGGPVHDARVFLLVKSPEAPPDSTRVLDDVFVSQSEALLEDLAQAGDGDARFRIYAGYSGWAPGQLDYEVSRGDWHVVPGDGDWVFADNVAEVWDSLIPPPPTQQVRYGDDPPPYATLRGAPWLSNRSVSSPTTSARSVSPRWRSSTESSP